MLWCKIEMLPNDRGPYAEKRDLGSVYFFSSQFIQAFFLKLKG